MATPRFIEGYNDLDETLLNRLMMALQFYEENESKLRNVIRTMANNQRRNAYSFWAFIWGYKAVNGVVGDYRWQYAWTEAVWDPDVSKFIQRPSEDSLDGVYYPWNSDDHSATGYGAATFGNTVAYNACENGNDGNRIESGGVNTNEAGDYPATWYLQPIQGDWQPPDDDDYEPQSEQTWALGRAPVVRMWVELDDENTQRFSFFAMNQHDGKCP